MAVNIWKRNSIGDLEAFNVEGRHIAVNIWRFGSGWCWSAYDEFEDDPDVMLVEPTDKPLHSLKAAKAAVDSWLLTTFGERA